MSDRYVEKKSQLPATYVQFIEKNEGWEGNLGDYCGYVQVWPKETIEAHWRASGAAQYLPDYWFPFGSNGASDLLCFDLRTKGDTSFLIPKLGLLEEEASEHCVSFELVATEIERRLSSDQA